MPPQTEPRIECISFLRCIAAALVVLYHTDLHILRLSGGSHIHAFGFAAAGTDLLFVISGFVMVYITRSGGIGFGAFMLRRLTRIAPLYWLLTMLMLLAFLAAPSLFHSTAFDLSHFVASLAFVPYQHPVLGIPRPFLFPGWAINHFMFFYALFALFALFLFLPSGRRVWVVSAILVSLAALWTTFYGANPLLDFYGAPIVVDFVVGMAVASAFLEHETASPLTIGVMLAGSAALFAVGVVQEVSGGNERFLFWGISAGGLLYSLVAIERTWGWRNPGLVHQLGEASFATYLSNLFTLAVVSKGLQATGLWAPLGLAGSQVLLVASALAGGQLVHVLAERPLQSLAARWRAAPVPAPKPDAKGHGAHA